MMPRAVIRPRSIGSKDMVQELNSKYRTVAAIHIQRGSNRKAMAFRRLWRLNEAFARPRCATKGESNICAALSLSSRM